MRNYDEKVKDISRSVLPSTGRKGARDTRGIIHKRQRTRELAGLTEYRRTADPDDETPDFRGKLDFRIFLRAVWRAAACWSRWLD
jgi:hypothetical protein